MGAMDVLCCRKKRDKYLQIQDADGKQDDDDESDMKKKKNQWKVLLDVLPYLWPSRAKAESYILVRVCCVIAMFFMVLAKVFTVLIPITSQNAVNMLAPTDGTAIEWPWGWVLAYGSLKLFSSVSANLRDCFFVQVSQNALRVWIIYQQRAAALETFDHLHLLSLRFHLNRKTGGVLRAIERGTQGIQFLLSFALFNILPTLLELGFVTAIMLWLFTYYYALMMLFTVVVYVAYTLSVTEWRTKFRREMNELNNDANNKAVDSLLNFETVKYFCNEVHESKRYDSALLGYMKASIKSQTSLALLNIGQALVIAGGMVGVMILSSYQVYKGELSVGEFVALQQYMLQLYIPLNFLGTSFRMIRTSLVNLEDMFSLLRQTQEVQDLPEATELSVMKGDIEFDDVHFSYDGENEVLKGVSFSVPAGKTVAIVGSTGAGKSTISKLLFRFYDITGGEIRIDGQDVRHTLQRSLRSNIGVVPQDTILFNDTIKYNVAYGRPDCTEDELFRATKLAQIHDFIQGLPDGYETKVGERGLRLSGGEKQRVAIARAILKDPRIMLFDEATSALDSKTEKDIQEALDEVSKGRTTLVIAHRLSTIVNAHEIVVLKDGVIEERGKFHRLMKQDGEFADMWRRQQESNEQDLGESIDRLDESRS